MDVDEDVDVKPKINESDDWTTPGNYHGKSMTDEIKTVEVSGLLSGEAISQFTGQMATFTRISENQRSR